MKTLERYIQKYPNFAPFLHHNTAEGCINQVKAKKAQAQLLTFTQKVITSSGWKNDSKLTELVTAALSYLNASQSISKIQKEQAHKLKVLFKGEIEKQTKKHPSSPTPVIPASKKNSIRISASAPPTTNKICEKEPEEETEEVATEADAQISAVAREQAPIELPVIPRQETMLERQIKQARTLSQLFRVQWPNLPPEPHAEPAIPMAQEVVILQNAPSIKQKTAQIHLPVPRLPIQNTLPAITRERSNTIVQSNILPVSNVAATSSQPSSAISSSISALVQKTLENAKKRAKAKPAPTQNTVLGETIDPEIIRGILQIQLRNALTSTRQKLIASNVYSADDIAYMQLAPFASMCTLALLEISKNCQPLDNGISIDGYNIKIEKDPKPRHSKDKIKILHTLLGAIKEIHNDYNALTDDQKKQLVEMLEKSEKQGSNKASHLFDKIVAAKTSVEQMILHKTDKDTVNFTSCFTG
jgi:hypothetical protein